MEWLLWKIKNTQKNIHNKKFIFQKMNVQWEYNYQYFRHRMMMNRLV